MQKLPLILKLLVGSSDLAADRSLRQLSAGHLSLPTGRIVACDPQVISGEEEPFLTAVPPGAYPVTLLLAKDDDGEWVAAAQIHFKQDPVVRWETARTPEDGDLEETGYGVDSGTGCFLDASALPQAVRFIETEEADALMDLEPGGEDQRFSLNFVLRDQPPANLVAFPTGSGEGLYASWFGFNEHGEPVCLLTDFEVVGAET
jgi:hypothetical protein